jgi:cell division protein FtsB
LYLEVFCGVIVVLIAILKRLFVNRNDKQIIEVSNNDNSQTSSITSASSVPVVEEVTVDYSTYQGTDEQEISTVVEKDVVKRKNIIVIIIAVAIIAVIASVVIFGKVLPEHLAVKDVSDKIAALDLSDSNFERFLSDAEKAYNELDMKQKNKIDNIQDLLDAREILEEINEQKANASVVDALISEIGDVTLADYDTITIAQNAYDNLTSDEKKYVNSKAILDNANSQLKKLITAAAEAGSAVGIVINGLEIVKDANAVRQGYSAYIKGVIKNVSGETISSASVSFSIEDANGNVIENASDHISDLGAGKTWQYSAMVFTNSAFRYSKFPEITVY